MSYSFSSSHKNYLLVEALVCYHLQTATQMQAMLT